MIALKIILPSKFKEYFYKNYFLIFNKYFFLIHNRHLNKLNFFSHFYFILVTKKIINFIPLDNINFFLYSYKKVFLLFDYKNNLVFKIGFGRGREIVRNNFVNLSFLNKIKINIIPAPYKINTIKKLIISSEKYLLGSNCSPLNQSLYRSVINSCSKIYRNNLLKISMFDHKKSLLKKAKHFYEQGLINRNVFIKISIALKPSSFDKKNISNLTYIHGDLTSKNIVIKNNNIFLIDFDRFQVNFPELDVITLLLFDLSKDYTNYFSLLNDPDFLNQFKKLTKILYEFNPEFSCNSANHETILGYYRIWMALNYYDDAAYNPDLLKYKNKINFYLY